MSKEKDGDGVYGARIQDENWKRLADMGVDTSLLRGTGQQKHSLFDHGDRQQYQKRPKK